MPASPLQTRLEQTIHDLSLLVHDLSGLTSENQQQLAIEIDPILTRLSHLLPANRNQDVTRDTATQMSGSDNLAALLFEEGRLETVLHSAHAGIWVLDLVKGSEVWSPELRELLGVDPDEPSRSETFFALIHPQDRQTSIENFKAFIQKGGPFYQEVRLLKPNGKVSWISVIGYVEQDQNGQPISVTGIDQDITGQKQAEEALKADLEAKNLLHEISKYDVLDTDISQLLQVILAAAIRTVSAEMGNIQLLQPEKQMLTIAAHQGFQPPFLQFFQDVDVSDPTTCGEALKSGSRVFVANVETSPIFAKTPALAVLQAAGVRAVNFAPLCSRSGKLLGVLSTYWRSPQVAEPDSLNLIDMIARQTADLIEHRQNEILLRKSNQALQKSENKFSQAFHSSPVAMAITRLSDGRYIDVNDNLCQLLGYSREEFLKQIGVAHIYQHAEELDPFLQRLKEQGSIRNVEKVILNRQGETLTGLMSVEQVEVGGEACLLTTILDITERKRGEAALRESENRFRAMADGTPVIIWVHNAAGELEFINRAYTEFLGVSFEQVQSNGWQPLVHPDDITSYVDAFVRCSQERRPYHAQARVRRHDGQWRWIDSIGQPRFSPSGEFLGMAGSSLDITEQKQAEEALRESEERYRQLVELYPDLVFIQSNDRFTFVNHTGLTVLGAEHLDQVVGKPVMDFIHPAYRDEVKRRMQTLNEKRQDVSLLEEQYLRLDGTPIDVVVIAVPFNDHGRPGALVVVRDITQQKRAEQALREVEVQRQLNEYREKERQEIARNLHDGPIQTLVGTLFNIQVAKEGIADPNIQMEYAQIALSLQGAVRELREVVNELRPPSLIRFGLTTSLKMYIEDFQEKHSELEIQTELAEVRTQIPEDIQLALFRVCQEALNNIVHHAYATQASLRLYIQNGELWLEVQDNGKGMPDETNLVDLTRNGHYGLAGMKERAEALGGSFTLTSIPGQGTIICVSTPTSQKRIR